MSSHATGELGKAGRLVRLASELNDLWTVDEDGNFSMVPDLSQHNIATIAVATEELYDLASRLERQGHRSQGREE